MDRRRPPHLRVVGALPGTHGHCGVCGARVRRINGAVYESTSDRYHSCRSTWDVLPEPEPRRLARVLTWLGRLLSW